ncbi:MAG: hypothetical protein A2078_01330 [Nitrospirae bacterium GWC2_57_9]|nr:MAG: hypothetical protein A2078_01330 [Nitrospirae bacterium GWC2_57_9]
MTGGAHPFFNGVVDRFFLSHGCMTLAGYARVGLCMGKAGNAGKNDERKDQCQMGNCSISLQHRFNSLMLLGKLIFLFGQ